MKSTPYPATNGGDAGVADPTIPAHPPHPLRAYLHASEPHIPVAMVGSPEVSLVKPVPSGAEGWQCPVLHPLGSASLPVSLHSPLCVPQTFPTRVQPPPLVQLATATSPWSCLPALSRPPPALLPSLFLPIHTRPLPPPLSEQRQWQPLAPLRPSFRGPPPQIGSPASARWGALVSSLPPTSLPPFLPPYVPAHSFLILLSLPPGVAKGTWA